jgi:hypothetical protein
MVTQLLFGEHFSVLETQGSWCRVLSAYDNYESWIDRKQVTPIQQHTFELLQAAPIYCSNELIQIISENSSGILFPLLMGSSLPNFDNGECSIENRSYSYEGSYVTGKLPFSKASLVDTAMMFMNAPYLWGGRSAFGIDCSGFTQIVYKLNGIRLRRDAHQQAEQGETLSFVEEAEPGDLAFFDNAEGRIVHVGIVLDNNKIIHASGKVRIDGFDHQGIYNSEKRDYTHSLRILKRII